jgi:hypothetical protein
MARYQDSDGYFIVVSPKESVCSLEQSSSSRAQFIHCIEFSGKFTDCQVYHSSLICRSAQQKEAGVTFLKQSLHDLRSYCFRETSLTCLLVN